MLRVVVRERGASDGHELVFEKVEVTIGRIQGNDIVLPKGNVSKRHARVVLRDGKMIVVDLKSTNGTFVNGRKLTSPIVVREEDHVYIGDFMIALATDDEQEHIDTLDADPTESRLLAAIAQNDAASREVYADWLEQQGHSDRAQFIRVQDEIASRGPEDTPVNELAEQLRELAKRVDIAWRLKVARPMVEGCLGLEVQCPRDWGAMASTTRSDVRYCNGCRQHVYYCTTIESAREHAMRRDCIAVDASLMRYPNDTQRPPRPIIAGRPVAAPPGGVRR